MDNIFDSKDAVLSRAVLDTEVLNDEVTEGGGGNSNSTKSKYKIILMGGVDASNKGEYGTNKQLGDYIEKIALSSKYKIPLPVGDIQIVNSPILAEQSDAKDLYDEILSIVKTNFDINNGTLILYGYSWGGQLLMEFLNFFRQSGIKIKLLITVDAAKGFASFAVNNDVTVNVKYNLNMYQTKPSSIGSCGGANEGKGVKNVNLTGESNSKGEDIVHSNIDEYTLLYSAQVIIYALKNDFSFYNQSEDTIKNQIGIYASSGF